MLYKSSVCMYVHVCLCIKQWSSIWCVYTHALHLLVVVDDHHVLCEDLNCVPAVGSQQVLIGTPLDGGRGREGGRERGGEKREGGKKGGKEGGREGGRESWRIGWGGVKGETYTYLELNQWAAEVSGGQQLPAVSQRLVFPPCSVCGSPTPHHHTTCTGTSS